MKRVLITIIISLPYLLQAQIPSGYYSTATSTGYTLKTELHNIINGHTVVSYSALWTHYGTTDIDASDSFIWDMYSENPSGTDPYNFTLSTDQCGNYTGESSCYNREHSFPKSWFNDGSPMLTDIHHVVPTDGFVNGQRSNHPFGDVASATFTSQNGSKVGSSAVSGYSGTVFEPIDEYKGDFARIYFYMATRYEDVLSTWTSDMLDGSTDQVYTTAFLDMLISWHNADPVDQKEIDRNDAIYYNVQSNRNPFVDHPEYVGSIWSSTLCSGVPSTQVSNLGVASIASTSATLSWTSGDGSNRLVVVRQGSAASLTPVNATTYTGVSSDFSSATDQAGSGNFIVYNSTGSTVDVTGLTAETTYHIQVFEYCSDGPNYNTTSAPVSSFTTSATPSTIQSENFTTCGSSTWSAQDEGGTATWVCASGYMSMDGFGDGTSEDWLISPIINLDNYTNETFEFFSRARYNGGTDIEVLYSTSYAGSGTPSGFVTISTSNYTLPTPGSGTTYSDWTSSGNIDISAISGTTVYFAFRYTSDGTGAGSETWEVDDITISGVNAGSPCTEPTAQATSLLLTPSENQVDGSFTASGSADGYLVIQSTSSSLSGDPVDATSYGINDALGGGTVIANISSTSFSATSLTSGTQYYYFVYAYNNSGCSGGPDYYITTPLSGNTTTTTPPACSEPTAQPTSFGSSVVGSTQIDGSFTNASGTPDGYLVIVSTNAAYSGTPTDATTYSSGSSISDGTVVQYSSLNSFSATGLTASTAYYFYIFSYNDASCSGGPNYYVTSPLTGNATTDAAGSATDLFISEYIEGSGNNKYLEIFNGTGSSVDLSLYDIVQHNGGSSTILNTLTLTGTLADNSTFTIENSSEGQGFTADLSTTNSVMQFNGDDAVILRKSGVNIDIIGQIIDIDPGSEWGSGLTSTADNTIRRMSTIDVGDSDGTDTFDPSTEWDGFSTDDITDLGSHAFTGSIPCSINTISSFTPTTGTQGTRINILGSNFTSGAGTSAVKFNGIDASSFNVISSTEIEAVIPSGSTSGQITITTNACANTSTQSFTIVGSNCPVTSGATDLFISEYVEGSSNNKYLEIFNGTGSSVDLSFYDLALYRNGSTTVTTFSSLSGILANNAFYTLGNSSAALSHTPNSTNNSTMSFNGDDVVALRKNGVNIDIIGQIGNDPGSQWGTGLASTNDNTLRRKSNILSGDADGTDTFNPSTEWDGYLFDNIDDLGSHTFVGSGSSPIITVNPTDQNECSTATFSVTATGTVDSYQWKYFNGNVWGDLSDGGFYSGTTTNTLSVTNFDASIDEYQFYCEVVESGVCTNVTTTNKLTVFGASGNTGEWGGGTSSSWSDCKNWADGSVPTASSDITLVNSGSTPQVTSDVTVNNLTISSGVTLEIQGATTLTVAGDLTVASGAFLDGNNASSNITLTGSRNNFSMSGTLQPSTDINIGSGAEIALSTAVDLPNESNDLTVLSGGILDLNGFNLTGNSGDFILNAGGGIKITSADGITTAGNASGNIQADARSFDTGANYYYTGGNTQVTGNALPATVNDLNIEKTSNNVTLTSSVNVNGNLNISGTGNLLTGSNNVTLSSTSNITGTEDTDSHIEGTIQITKSIDNTTDSPGNIGVSLTTVDNLGSTVVTRVTGSNGVVTVGSNSGIATTWTITPTTQPSSAVTGTFEWLSTFDNSITSSLEVWKNSGSGWALLQSVTDVGSGDLRSVAFSTSSFSDFTVTNTSNPLPVALMDFVALREGDHIALYWTTASEINNDGFEIEKSFDSENYQQIGFVEGNGTSDFEHKYYYEDKERNCGAYYRLKQIDFDGKYEYSNSVTANCGLEALVDIYPNPINDNEQFTINLNPDIDAEARIIATIYDLTGQKIINTSAKANNIQSKINQDIIDINKGSYILLLTIGDKTIRHHFIKS